MNPSKLYAGIGLIAILAYIITNTDGQPLLQYAGNFEVIGHVFLLLACADWLDKHSKKRALTDRDAD